MQLDKENTSQCLVTKTKISTTRMHLYIVIYSYVIHNRPYLILYFYGRFHLKAQIWRDKPPQKTHCIFLLNVNELCQWRFRGGGGGRKFFKFFEDQKKKKKVLTTPPPPPPPDWATYLLARFSGAKKKKVGPPPLRNPGSAPELCITRIKIQKCY